MQKVTLHYITRTISVLTIVIGIMKEKHSKGLEIASICIYLNHVNGNIEASQPSSDSAHQLIQFTHQNETKIIIKV